MKLNKQYLYFRRWFRSVEISIYQGQWSDKNIARNGFNKGYDYAMSIPRINKCNCSKCGGWDVEDLYKEDETNHIQNE